MTDPETIANRLVRVRNRLLDRGCFYEDSSDVSDATVILEAIHHIRRNDQILAQAVRLLRDYAGDAHDEDVGEVLRVIYLHESRQLAFAAIAKQEAQE